MVEFATAGQAALPVRIDGYREIAVHETADPEVIVAEYELAGTAVVTCRRATAGFVGVLRVRAGKIVLWREYQDGLALSAAPRPSTAAPDPVSPGGGSSTRSRGRRSP